MYNSAKHFSEERQTKLRIRLLGFDQGADPKEEAGVSHGADQGGEIGMSETPGVVKGCFSKNHTL